MVKVDVVVAVGNGIVQGRNRLCLPVPGFHIGRLQKGPRRIKQVKADALLPTLCQIVLDRFHVELFCFQKAAYVFLSILRTKGIHQKHDQKPIDAVLLHRRGRLDRLQFVGAFQRLQQTQLHRLSCCIDRRDPRLS